ncbi:MAG: zinc ABC transporter substrate-binding protein [Planctomycetes bacterium]|nr:zinc ABC transporter substrate-binding protein [Planctomycetota bacterium]
MELPRKKPGRATLVLLAALVGAALATVALWPRGGAAGRDGKLHLVCTFLPVYVFTLNVVADVPDVDVRLLVERDVGCPHSYSLTGQDLKLLSEADVIVANGLGVEPFLDRVTRGQHAAEVITISDECDVLRLRSGEAEADDHDHADDHADHHHDPSDVNPHTWVSPRQAAIEVRTLARKLGQVAPPRAEAFRANGEAYARRLESLAGRMEAAARSFTNRNIVTGHAAFDYLARDLGLNVVATLSVVPGETGSAAQMARLIDTIRRTHAAAVFWEPPFADKVAQTIARDGAVPVYPLNPFNTDAGLPPAATLDDTRRMYENVMEQNLATLQRALTTTTAPAE